MMAQRGLTFVELDQRASTAEKPYGIITADCSDPHEIDDGVFVEPLPTAQEMYRVGVCVADTSRLYENKEVFTKAFKQTAAKYYELPGGERGYDAMLDPEVIRDLEFREGHIRNALILSFIVGKSQPPSELSISFGKVEVTKNFDYKNFRKQCRDNEADEKFGRASAFILKHLRYTTSGDYDTAMASGDHNAIHHRLINGSSRNAWLQGSKLNEAYMVAANHLVGVMLADEGRPAIYRVHNPGDESFLEFLPADIARYSRTPGWHTGLNLNPYCRVTSPLRRLEDWVMNYQLKQRDMGFASTLRDVRDVAAAIQQLNRHVMQEILQGPLRLSRHDTLGRGAVVLGKAACTERTVISLQNGNSEAAIA